MSKNGNEWKNMKPIGLSYHHSFCPVGFFDFAVSWLSDTDPCCKIDPLLIPAVLLNNFHPVNLRNDEAGQT
jgi:hypothetical protein